MLTPLISCLVAATLPGGVVLFRGAPGGAGDVQVVEASGAAHVPSGLAGITLLGIDFNGRVQIDALSPGEPRFRQDIPGASRIELQNERGSLYAYSRPAAGGALDFGVLIVDANGEARSVFELRGTGAAQDVRPFLERIAIAPGGNRVLIASTFEAGGDLFDVDLTTGAARNRTSALPPQSYFAAGLHLTASWGIAGTSTGVLRFDRSNLLGASSVAFPTAPAWFSGEIVTSANGLHAATSAGADALNAHVFVFDLASAARQVTSSPARVSPAGFLPEWNHGPYMAVSDDAAWCAWRTETVTAREAFLAPVPAAAPSNNVQVTADANYIDTLDEIGWFMFRGVTQRLVIAVGARTGAAIENLDFYSVTPSASGTPGILNLTQTNGYAQPPFLEQSDIKPNGLYALPGTTKVLVHSEQSGGSGEILVLDTAQSGVQTLLADAKELTLAEPGGSRSMLLIRRANGPKDRELYALSAPYMTVGPVLMTIPGLHELTRPAARADGWFGFVETTPTQERVWRYSPSANAVAYLTNRPLFYGPSIGWTPSGELAFTVGAGGVSSIYAVWPTTSTVARLPVGVGPGFVLPGS